MERREAVGCHGDEQAAAGLGVAEQGALGFGEWADVVAIAFEIAVSAAGSAVLGDVMVGIGQARDFGTVDYGADIAALAQLDEVAPGQGL